MKYEHFSPGGRLLLCASMVRQGARLADIGTDHAYLPVWLALHGRISQAVASDVRVGPLGAARRNVARFGVENKVSLRLSDGLEKICAEEADDIVMAGMGGNLIARIIASAPWLRQSGKHLILQPQTSVEDLRVFLAREGFAVLREEAALEGRHVYTVMLCAYEPEKVSRDVLYPYIGCVSADTPENRAYLRRQIARLERKASGLRISGSTGEAEESALLAEKIRTLLEPEKDERMENDDYS